MKHKDPEAYLLRKMHRRVKHGLNIWVEIVGNGLEWVAVFRCKREMCERL